MLLPADPAIQGGPNAAAVSGGGPHGATAHPTPWPDTCQLLPCPTAAIWRVGAAQGRKPQRGLRVRSGVMIDHGSSMGWAVVALPGSLLLVH